MTDAPPVLMPDGRLYYVLLVHPDVLRALELTPREKWKMQHRAQRMRAKGYPANPLLVGAIGEWSGVRLIRESRP